MQEPSLTQARSSVPSWQQVRVTAVRQPTAPPLGLGSKDNRVLGFADILTLPEADWARPQHAEERRQAYADAEARVQAAMWPTKLPADTKRTTSATVRAARDVRELLALLEEGMSELVLMPHGTQALRIAIALANGGVKL